MLSRHLTSHGKDQVGGFTSYTVISNVYLGNATHIAVFSVNDAGEQYIGESVRVKDVHLVLL